MFYPMPNISCQVAECHSMCNGERDSGYQKLLSIEVSGIIQD